MANTERKVRAPRLQAATAAAGGTPGGVGGDRRHVLNAANLDATTRERPERRLRTRSRRLGAVATLRRVRERAQPKGQGAEVEGRGEKGAGVWVAGPERRCMREVEEDGEW